MALKIRKETKYKNITKIYVKDEDEDEVLVYQINKKTKLISFYLKDEDPFIEEITIEGFTSLPSEFNEKGYIKSGLLYYFNKKLQNKKVSKFLISKNKKTSARKVKNKISITLKYSDFAHLRRQIQSVIEDSRDERNNAIDDFFHRNFPKNFSASSGVSDVRRKNKVVDNLDSSIIKKLSRTEIDKIIEFYQEVVEQKYSSSSKKEELIRSSKIKVDTIAIDEVVREFEEKLSVKTSEANWGKFLKRNLFLIDSKYVESLPQLNVVLAGARTADFGLADIQGYLDIFEIKLPKTKLLSAKKDRGNYYFHSETVRAITQLEKYLYNAERKANDLSADIFRESGINVDVVKPRAILLVGQSSQLDSSSKREDFRVLRHSLKNIEILLYDELLERIKNQKNKIFPE